MTKKLLAPAAINTARYPVGDGFPALVQPWAEGQASVDAYASNTLAATNYLNWFNDTWIPQYSCGRDIPWDANPPAPPKQKWALTTTEDNGTFSYDLVDAPTGALVCAVPAFHRLSAPVRSTGSLRTAPEVTGNPTIATVEVGTFSTDSAGHVWVRTQ